MVSGVKNGNLLYDMPRQEDGELGVRITYKTDGVSQNNFQVVDAILCGSYGLYAVRWRPSSPLSPLGGFQQRCR